MRVVFFGTSSFAARILSFLLAQGVDIVAVVTRPDRPKGRNLQLSYPPVKELLLQNQSILPILQPLKASTPEIAEQLKSYQADLFLVVAYGEIIKKNILDIPRLGCVNIHASLLPKYRGAAPIQRCLMAGESKTGITLIDMTPEMDAGDMLAQSEIPLPPEMNFAELDHKLCELACGLTLATLTDLTHGKVLRVPQDHSKVTFAPKLTPEEEKIDWAKSATEIFNLIRALSPTPCAWCSVLLGQEEKRLKIKRAELIHEPHNQPPKTLLAFGKQGWIVACGSGALRLTEIQLEGKRAMPAEEFLKGVHHPLAMK